MIKIKELPSTLRLKEPSYLSPSGYCNFRRCEARYFFSQLLGLSIPEPKAPLDYGSAIHEAMPYVQRGQMEKAIQTFAKSWKASGNEEDSKRNMGNAMKLLESFFRENIESGTLPYEILSPPEGALKVSKRDSQLSYSDDEFAFCVHMGGLFPCVGRIDALTRLKATGNIWPLDYKTTSELGARFVGAFQLNAQAICYVAAAKIMLPREEIEGFFVEALRVTAKNPESLRIPVFIPDFRCDVFLEDFTRTCEDISKRLDSGTFHQSFSSCTSYSAYGQPGYKCIFETLCSSQDWTSLLPAFEQKFFDPFEDFKSEEDFKREKEKDETKRTLRADKEKGQKDEKNISKPE